MVWVGFQLGAEVLNSLESLRVFKKIINGSTVCRVLFSLQFWEMRHNFFVSGIWFEASNDFFPSGKKTSNALSDERPRATPQEGAFKTKQSVQMIDFEATDCGELGLRLVFLDLFGGCFRWV